MQEITTTYGSWVPFNLNDRPAVGMVGRWGVDIEGVHGSPGDRIIVHALSNAGRTSRHQAVVRSIAGGRTLAEPQPDPVRIALAAARGAEGRPFLDRGREAQTAVSDQPTEALQALVDPTGLLLPVESEKCATPTEAAAVNYGVAREIARRQREFADFLALGVEADEAFPAAGGYVEDGPDALAEQRLEYAAAVA